MSRDQMYIDGYLRLSLRPWRQADRNLILEHELQARALTISREYKVRHISHYQTIVEYCKVAKRTAIEVVDEFLLKLESTI